MTKMDMPPLISIVIPVYNVAMDLLNKMLTSIENQTSENFEAIIINDGSTNSYIFDVLEDFKRNTEKNVHIYHESNRGLAGTRNFGVRQSSGKWIMFLDGDDWLEYNTIEILSQEISKSDNDLIIFGTIKYMDSDNRYRYKYPYKINYDYVGQTGQDYFLKLLFDFNGNAAAAYSKIFKKKLIDKVPHDDKLKQGAEGIEFNSRLYQHFDSARFINYYLYNYVYNGDSISSKPSEENNYLIIKGFEKIRVNLQERLKPDTLDFLINKRLQYVIITSIISGFFHPKNNDSFYLKKKRANTFLQNPIVNTALNFNGNKKLNRTRKIIIYLIKAKKFYALNLLAKVRYYQKKSGKKVI